MRKNALRALCGILTLVVLMIMASSLMDITRAKVVSTMNAVEEISPYAETYEIGSCAVGVRKDSTGVDIAAMDKERRSDYTLVQNITITNDAENKVRVHKEYRMIPKIAGLFPITIESAYDVFYKHCRENAQWLPAEVKKLFFGQYGIE